MKKIHGFLVLIVILCIAGSCENKYSDAPDGIYAEIKTNKGTMLAELYYQAAPLTVSNFVALAEGKHEMVQPDSLKGKPFYNGLTFHRIIKDFMIQGGDQTGTGAGSPGYRFDQEIVDTLKHNAKGILSMANAGPNTNGSQFFIMHAPKTHLDGGYNVFGKVIEGLAVVDSIATTPTAERDKPIEPMIMQEVNIIRKGRDAKKWDAFKTFNGIIDAKEALKKKKEEAATQFRNEKVTAFEKMRASAQSYPSGLKIYVRKKGSGQKPELGTKISLDYSGFFDNGKLFDTSVEQDAINFNNLNERKQQANGYRPIPVKYDPSVGMVPGFREALLTMNYGDQITAFVPAALAYGERGAGGVIPPNADLIFEMHLLPKE